MLVGSSVMELDTSSALRTESLSVSYAKGSHKVDALRNVTIGVEQGGTLGIIGESGSGKSTLASALIRLLPRIAKVTGGVLLGSTDLMDLSDAQMRSIRGKHIGMVFQDSLASMNPLFTINSQLLEIVHLHEPHLDRQSALDKIGDLLEEMGIDRKRGGSFPHEFSGGMRQRVMIAAALLPEPKFLIADESTSDLDMISQKQILTLLQRVQATRGLGLIVISHDFAVVQYLCKDVAVLYRSDLVEHGSTEEILTHPTHPYTRGLVQISRKIKGPNDRLPTLPSRGQ